MKSIEQSARHQRFFLFAHFSQGIVAIDHKGVCDVQMDDIRNPVFGDIAKNIFQEVAVHIKDRTAPSVYNVLKDEGGQKVGLSRTRLSEDVGMHKTVILEHPKDLPVGTEIAPCEITYVRVPKDHNVDSMTRPFNGI